MTPERINIAIAESVGWRLVTFSAGAGWVCPNTKVLCSTTHDYCNDLNAMHEVEATLSHIDLTEHWFRLEEMRGTKGAAYATALQRAEAYLRVIGKWEEEA